MGGGRATRPSRPAARRRARALGVAKGEEGPAAPRGNGSCRAGVLILGCCCAPHASGSRPGEEKARLNGLRPEGTVGRAAHGSRHDGAVRLTKYGHACVRLEKDGRALVMDPGEMTPEPEALQDVEAVLITHEHFDHLDARKLRDHPSLPVYTCPGVARSLT